MQQTMHSYVCGINLRSEILLFCQIYISRKIGVPEFDRNVFIRGKVSELVFIPQMQESIGCCMTFPDF